MMVCGRRVVSSIRVSRAETLRSVRLNDSISGRSLDAMARFPSSLAVGMAVTVAVAVAIYIAVARAVGAAVAWAPDDGVRYESGQLNPRIQSRDVEVGEIERLDLRHIRGCHSAIPFFEMSYMSHSEPDEAATGAPSRYSP